MKKLDIILGRIMVIPILVFVWMLSPVATIIWYLCFVFDNEGIKRKGVTKTISPTLEYIGINGCVLISVKWLHRKYFLFRIKKKIRPENKSYD